jgi:hypothetical protein
MQHACRVLAVSIAALLGTGESAQAAQPPDIVTSEAGNTAMGSNALAYNSIGIDNTAVGFAGLHSNASGNYNTASGSSALFFNTTGSYNSATGAYALYLNTTGDENTATGTNALQNNTIGGLNTAVGRNALISNGSGTGNTALGHDALYSNSDGDYNSAIGMEALYSNTNGALNLAFGQNALHSVTTGSNNIAVGINAGYAVTGSNNIDIGHTGAAGQNGVIHIGTSPHQTEVYIAGISTTKLTGAAVYVNSAGQLGVLASSERYKTAIEPMGTTTQRLNRLRPVSYHLKTDPNGAVQYGLIAEEVDKVYPELVIRDEAGNIQGVRYEELAPMLLSVVQQQNARLDALERQLSEMRKARSRPTAAGAVFAHVSR